jgi:hypothetical protein
MRTLKQTTFGMIMLCGMAGGSLAADAQAKMAAFDWLAGHWCQEKKGQVIEESWLPARGGMLLSVGRTVAAGSVRSFEFLRLELREGVVTFVAQPNGLPPTPFKLTDSGSDWARFENPQHDFPRRVEYRLTPTGLRAQISGPGEGGKQMVIRFDYVPCPTGAPSR